ncbi:(Fe-S)-binding protein [Syntrophomonas erecta]
MIFAFRPLEGGYPIPMRVVGANIPYEWIIYILMLIPIGFFIYGFWLRSRIWSQAQGELHRNDQVGRRILSVLGYTLGQKKIIEKPLPGWMHFFLFWGFVFLFIATASFAMWDKIGFPPLTGNFYIYFSWIVDITGFLAMIGITILAVIRYWQRPDRLNDTKPMDGWLLLLIFAILFTGYIIEGLRVAAQIKLSATMSQIAYERAASPIGWWFAGMFPGMSLESILSWHRFSWWFHMAIAFIFIAAIPFTKLWHIFTGMIGYYSRDLGPSAARPMGNLEEAETYGVERIEELGWKDLLDLDACIRCGRCQEGCPAYNTGKALNPKTTIIQAMKKHLDNKSPFLLAVDSGDPQDALTMTVEDEVQEVNESEKHLIYDIVTPQVLWDCTNCGACVEHCPMFIEHIDKIIEMRRNLVMWQGDMPSEAQMAFTNTERNYNPWGVGWASRAEWLKERDIRDLVNLLPEDGGEFDYLLYAGCAAAFDDRYKRVGEALVRLLHQAGVSFGYLGTEEYCCGEWARRLGNEYLWQTLAKSNIENFDRYGVKKIICICPHGYNTIKNEYSQLGADYEVYHSTEILGLLLAEGKLNRGGNKAYQVSYHDSCFLGRHNNIYQEPREVIKAAGGQLLDIEKSKQFGFCCGAGGGRMWLEEESIEGFKRINQTRTEQLLEVDPEVIAVNCPYCLTMISDGVKETKDDSSIRVMDVCELLWQTQSS